MTVFELMNYLSDMPHDAEVMIKHELMDDEHSVERVEAEYTKNKTIVWLGEIPK